MNIIKHGDVIRCECKYCGCIFEEAVTKTGLSDCGVYDRDKNDTGTWMICPDCGNKSIGFRVAKR